MVGRFRQPGAGGPPREPRPRHTQRRKLQRPEYFSPTLNNAGQTAFFANLTGSGVDATNDLGIWSEGTGSLALVAREGSHAPGTPSGVNFNGFDV